MHPYTVKGLHYEEPHENEGEQLSSDVSTTVWGRWLDVSNSSYQRNKNHPVIAFHAFHQHPPRVESCDNEKTC